MMVPKKSLALTGAALFALTAFANAQSQSGKIFRRYNKPLKTATLDLETGTITRGPSVNEQVATTTVDFDNLDLAGFVAVDTGSGFCEWMDTGTKGNGTGGAAGGPVPSDLVSNFIFAYCSAALSTLSGGPGGTMNWTFFPSHATGAAHPATSNTIGTFTLGGLPSNTVAGAVFGQMNCFFINITFGALPLAFPDGPFGYSWTFVDLDSAGVFAATLPFLACVTSCSGFGPDSQGMDDFIDQYCPAGIPGSAPLASFTFGTAPGQGNITSINIDLREVDVLATASVIAPDLGLNLDSLTTSPVVIGATWTASLTSAATRSGVPVTAWTLFVQDAFIAPGIPLDIGTIAGLDPAPLSEFHVTGAPFLGIAPIAAGPIAPNGGTVSFSTGVPLTTAILCLPWCTQALVLGDISGEGGPLGTEVDPMFSTGIEGIVGSH